MKKKILLLLSVIILATTAITAPTVAQADTVETTTAEQPSYKVTTIKAKTMYTTKKCNVRKEPTAKSKSVGTLKKNQKVTVIGKTKVKGKLWYQIKTKKGNVKFVLASKLCTYKVTAIKAKTMYTTKKCNVRKEPSAKSKSVGTLKKNQKVTVIGKTKVKGKLWYQIKTKKGNVKFVSASLLMTQKVKVQKQTPAPSKNTNKSSSSSSNSNKSSSGNTNKSSSSGNTSSSGGSGKVNPNTGRRSAADAARESGVFEGATGEFGAMK